MTVQTVFAQFQQDDEWISLELSGVYLLSGYSSSLCGMEGNRIVSERIDTLWNLEDGYAFDLIHNRNGEKFDTVQITVINQRITWRPKGLSAKEEDLVLYDFTLQSEESVWLYFRGGTSKALYIVESRSLLNGKVDIKLKKIYDSSNAEHPDEIRWVQHEATAAGLLYVEANPSSTLIYDSYLLSCFNGELLNEEIFEACGELRCELISGFEKGEPLPFEIQNQHLKLIDQSVSRIEISDMSGRIIVSEANPDYGQNWLLQRNQLYIVRISRGSNMITQKILMK